MEYTSIVSQGPLNDKFHSRNLNSVQRGLPIRSLSAFRKVMTVILDVEAHVIPTSFRLCHWSQTTFAKAQTLPREDQDWSTLTQSQKWRNEINNYFPVQYILGASIVIEMVEENPCNDVAGPEV